MIVRLKPLRRISTHHLFPASPSSMSHVCALRSVLRPQLNNLSWLAAAILIAATQLAAQSSGFNASEGTAISGSTGYDTMWADSTAHHWLMTNNNSGGTTLVTAWPCGASGGCIPISGATSIGGFFRENGLTFPTGGPGVPLLSGAANLPQWGAQPGSTGVYALDLQTGNYGLALATEVPNSSSGTGASPNLLAKITTGASGGATTATTSATDATVPTYIVVSGNGTTGNAQLAVDGQASCTMDAAVAPNSQGNYIVASTTTNGNCSAQYSTLASIPFGTWIVGQLITTSSILSGGLGQVLVHPGYRSVANGVSTPVTLTANAPIIGGGNKTLGVGTPSGNTTAFATASGTVSTTTNLTSWDGSGNVKDSGVATTSAALLIVGFCGGTIGTANATAYTLAPFAQGSAIGCALTTTTEMPVPVACTAKNLFVVAQTGGAVGTSGATTVYKNGTATSLSATLGTGTTKNDLTHTVSFAQGDTISIRVTTGQASDTTASIKASLICQ